MASVRNRHSARPSAIVVGAGVIGLLSALELHRRGWQVQLFDRVAAGTESSWAGGGVLSPILPWDYPQAIWRLSQRSLELYEPLATELAMHTDIDPELVSCGAWALDPQSWNRGLDWCRAEGLSAEVAECSLPGFEAPRPALSLPWLGQIRNPRLCRALTARLRQLGVVICEHEPVMEWLEQGGKLTGVRTTSGALNADVCVLAAGAWSGSLAALPVRPVRGQMLLLRASPGFLNRIVIDRGRYLIPRRDGRILVGSTVEDVGFDKRLTDEARESLLGFAGQVLGVDALRVETHWAGLRPGSVDGLPFIGEHAQRPGLFLNTGHYRNGLVMAPASAELLADLIENRPTRVDATAYRPSSDRLWASAET